MGIGDLRVPTKEELLLEMETLRGQMAGCEKQLASALAKRLGEVEQRIRELGEDTTSLAALQKRTGAKTQKVSNWWDTTRKQPVMRPAKRAKPTYHTGMFVRISRRIQRTPRIYLVVMALFVITVVFLVIAP